MLGTQTCVACDAANERGNAEKAAGAGPFPLFLIPGHSWEHPHLIFFFLEEASAKVILLEMKPFGNEARARTSQSENSNYFIPHRIL